MTTALCSAVARFAAAQARKRWLPTYETQVPPLAQPIWEAFWRLDQSRQFGAGFPQPFSYLEIQAWCSLSGEILARWEVEAIMSMDVVRRNGLSAKEQEPLRETGLRRSVPFNRASSSLFDRIAKRSGKRIKDEMGPKARARAAAGGG